MNYTLFTPDSKPIVQFYPICGAAQMNIEWTEVTVEYDYKNLIDMFIRRVKNLETRNDILEKMVELYQRI